MMIGATVLNATQRARLLLLQQRIKQLIREKQMTTQQPDLELKAHLNAEAAKRLANIFKMLHQLATHDDLKSDASRLSEIRQFLQAAVTRLEEKTDGSAEPVPGGLQGDRADREGSQPE